MQDPNAVKFCPLLKCFMLYLIGTMRTSGVITYGLQKGFS
jgi:hypothetical protein